MNIPETDCLTDEELFDAAAGRLRERDLTGHLETCASCRERTELMQKISQEIRERQDRLEIEHDAARERLLESLGHEPSTATETPVGRRHRAFSRLSGPLLFGVGGIATTAVAILLVFMLSTDRSASAMQQTAAAMRKATSYIVDTEMEFQDRKSTGRIYRAGSAMRMDTLEGDRVVTSRIFFKDKPGIDLDHKAKTYRHLPTWPGHWSPLMMLEKLAGFTGAADKTLGEKTIDGRKCSGFTIGVHRIDPDSLEGTVELWIDSETSLPLRMSIQSEQRGTMRFSNFQWNVNIPAERFNTTPPQTYSDKTPTPRTTDELVQDITDALKTYADIFDGQYPQVETVYGDVMLDRLMNKIGIRNRRPTEEQIRSEEYVKVLESTRGFASINMLQRESTEAIFHGKTVDAGEKNKVLFRWPLSDRDYQVIYGDLRSEKVSAARLRELEGE